MDINELITQGEEIYETKYTTEAPPKTPGITSFFIPETFIRDRNAKISWDELCSVFLHETFPNHPKVSEFEELYKKQNSRHYADTCFKQIAILKALSAIKATDSDFSLKNTRSISQPSMNKVFIVHGHNEELKLTVARFLEKLGLEAIILHEQANQGATIIEKLERCTDVGFAIVLYTHCDVGADINSADRLKKRARQNVVFEHGYLMAKLGRERVCAIYSEGIEAPGDMSGMVYIPNDAAGAWKFDIFKEMKAAGYDIDANKVL